MTVLLHVPLAEHEREIEPEYPLTHDPTATAFDAVIGHVADMKVSDGQMFTKRANQRRASRKECVLEHAFEMAPQP